MSFRGKLQLKPLAWTVHTQMPSPTAHIMKRETTFRCLVTGEGTASTVWGSFQECKCRIICSIPPSCGGTILMLHYVSFPSSWYWNHKIAYSHVNRWFPLYHCSFVWLLVTLCSYMKKILVRCTVLRGKGGIVFTLNAWVKDYFKMYLFRSKTVCVCLNLNLHGLHSRITF